MHYRESEEMYLETILLLEKKNGRARRVDIAAELGITKPSVTNAMKSLMNRGLIYDDDCGRVHLTDAGRSRAEDVYERHHLLTLLLLHLGADPIDAEENACRIEHVISPELMETLRRYMAGISDVLPATGD